MSGHTPGHKKMRELNAKWAGADFGEVLCTVTMKDTHGGGGKYGRPPRKFSLHTTGVITFRTTQGQNSHKRQVWRELPPEEISRKAMMDLLLQNGFVE